MATHRNILQLNLIIIVVKNAKLTMEVIYFMVEPSLFQIETRFEN